MSKRIPALSRPAFVLAILAGLYLAARPASAEPQLSPQDSLVARMVCTFVQKGHLNRPEIGDEISKRLFHRFLKDLDPAKLYFQKSDVAEFQKYETELNKMLPRGDLSFAYKVYDRFLARIKERVKLAEELAAVPQDFTVKEYLQTDPDTLDFAATDNEIRERWRKRIKFDLLLHKIGPPVLADAEARKKVLERYQGLLKRYKQVDNYDLMEMYLTDLTTSIDPHSTYMSPATVDDFNIAMRLNLDGIGALLRSDNGKTMVVEVVPGGAAAADGRLKPKDQIVGVAQADGILVDTMDMKLREVVKLIRGPRGSKVRLKVIPAGKIEPVVIDLTRQKIELKAQEARGDIVEEGRKAEKTPYRIGVIDLPSFYFSEGLPGSGEESKSCAADVRKILRSFKTAQVDAVVLDLRRNGGGSLRETLALTGLFIDQGPIVQVRGSDERVKHLDDPESGVVYGGPLVVLVSRFSASASEILAGALQDYGRALIVGDTATHGKGTVQMVIDLGSRLREESPPNLGDLKLTIQKFYRVNGDSTQSRGVASDVVLPSLTEELATPEKELDHALAFDRVNPVDHQELGLVPAELKAVLKDRSARRVKESNDFVKLMKDIEILHTRKNRKTIPLNEQELRAQFTKDDAEKLDKKAEEVEPSDGNSGEITFKFKRNFFNNEILKITEDFLQGNKLTAER